MKDNYKKSISLRCEVCGNSDQFESNEDNSYIKCKACGKEYNGGYDELVEYNQALISEELEKAKEEVFRDVHKDISDIFKKAFKGKNIKIK